MLKNIILVENQNDFQCDTLDEVVRKLIGEDFYSLSQEEKQNKMEMLATANCINNSMQVVGKGEIDKCIGLYNKFIIYDEMTYILSLLRTNNIVLLEKIDSEVFTKTLDKSSFEKNYIIVNKYAEELLKKYLEEKGINI